MVSDELPDQTGISDGTELFKFGLVLGSWTVLVVAYLHIAGMLTPQSLFVGVFVGHLVLVELTTMNDPVAERHWALPRNDQPAERHWLLRWSVRVGYLLFGYFMYNDIVAIVTLG